MVVVNRDVRLSIDRSQLMLRGSHLVVLCLRAHSDFPEFLIDILHKGRDPLTDRSEIVIIQLLSLRRHRSEKCTPCIDQILSLKEFLCVHKEILLLRSDRRSHSL